MSYSDDPFNHTNIFPQDSELMWRNLYHSLVRYVWSWIHWSHVSSWQGQEDDIVKDIVQEVVVRVFKYIHTVLQNEELDNVSFERIGLHIARKYCTDLEEQDMPLIHFSLMDPSQEVSYVEEMHFQETSSRRFVPSKNLDAFARIAKSLPINMRQVVLTDLANRTDIEEYVVVLRQAFQNVGVRLENYQQSSFLSVPKYTHKAQLLCEAYQLMKIEMIKLSEQNSTFLEDKQKDTTMKTHHSIEFVPLAHHSTASAQVYQASNLIACTSPFHQTIKRLAPSSKEEVQDKSLETTSNKQSLEKKENLPEIETQGEDDSMTSLLAEDTEIRVQNDPELSAISRRLRETASFAIDPMFKEELRKRLLQKFTEHKDTEMELTGSNGGNEEGNAAQNRADQQSLDDCLDEVWQRRTAAKDSAPSLDGVALTGLQKSPSSSETTRGAGKKPITDDQLLKGLPSVASEIANFPEEERNAVLTDLANNLPEIDEPSTFEQALLEEGLQLQDYRQRSLEDSLENEELLRRAYSRIMRHLKEIYPRDVQRDESKQAGK